MQGWAAPLIGTGLGLSLVAAAAALVLPERPVVDVAPLVRALRIAVAPRPPAEPVPAPARPAPLAPAVAAAPRPSVAVVPRNAPAPLPDLPPPAPEAPFGIEGLLRPSPGRVSNGTGFFVTSRGTLLTAEHVVRGCRGVRVLSAHMRPENAQVLATDAANDVAVLEVPGLTSPAWLPVAPPSRGAGRLFVLGFPANSLPDTPNETWARLANGAFGPQAPVITDPARLVWFRSGDVTFGYSGGPVVDLAGGRVVGISSAIFSFVPGGVMHGVATEGLAVGAGATPMLALLSRWAVREGVVPAALGVESTLDLARRATVRVVCSR
jgi:S1-C subfamily serine protease